MDPNIRNVRNIMNQEFREQFGVLPLADSSFSTQRRMLSEPRGQDLFGRHFREQFGGAGTGLLMERSQNGGHSLTMGHLDPQFGLIPQDSATGYTNQRVRGAGTGLLMKRSQNGGHSLTMGHLDPQFGLTSQDSATGSTNQRVSSLPLASSGKDFFLKHKMDLENRLPSVLNPILSQLQQKKVLNDHEREDVMSKHTTVDRNSVLLTMIQNKGATAQQLFYEVLKEEDPCLVKDLEG